MNKFLEKINQYWKKFSTRFQDYFQKISDESFSGAIKKTYLAGLGISFGLAFLFAIYSYTLPIQFKSEATLKLSENIVSSTKSQNSFGILPLSPLGSSSASKDLNFVKERIDSIDFFESFVSNESNYKNLVKEYGQNRKITKVRLHKFFKRIVSVNVNYQTGFLEISCTSSDKIFAYETLVKVIDAFNQEQRLIDKKSIQSDIDFLNSTLLETNNVSVQSAVSNIMESKIQKLLNTNNPSDYYLEVISSGFIPERKVSPNRYTFLFIGYWG